MASQLPTSDSFDLCRRVERKQIVLCSWRLINLILISNGDRDSLNLLRRN